MQVKVYGLVYQAFRSRFYLVALQYIIQYTPETTLIAVKHLVSPVMLPVEIRLQYMTKSEERNEELCRKMWDLSENQTWHVLNASQTPLYMH